MLWLPNRILQRHRSGRWQRASKGKPPGRRQPVGRQRIVQTTLATYRGSQTATVALDRRPHRLPPRRTVFTGRRPVPARSQRTDGHPAYGCDLTDR
jgi:hypothetical protein